MHATKVISRQYFKIKNDPVSIIKYKLASAYITDSSLSVYLQSDQSLSFLPEETLDPWLSIMHPSKTDQTVSFRLAHRTTVPFAKGLKSSTKAYLDENSTWHKGQLCKEVSFVAEF